MQNIPTEQFKLRFDVAGARKVGWLEAPEAFAVVELLTAGSTLSDGAGADDGEGAGYSGS